MNHRDIPDAATELPSTKKRSELLASLSDKIQCLVNKSVPGPSFSMGSRDLDPTGATNISAALSGNFVGPAHFHLGADEDKPRIDPFAPPPMTRFDPNPDHEKLPDTYGNMYM